MRAFLRLCVPLMTACVLARGDAGVLIASGKDRPDSKVLSLAEMEIDPEVVRIIPEGMDTPILIGEVMPADGDPSGTLPEADRQTYEAGLACFLAGDWAGFRRVTAGLTGDGPTEFVTKFILSHPDEASPADWNGGIAVKK